jgi:hypothetical protein
MGVVADVVSADWVALASLWETPSSPPPTTKMIAQMLKRVGRWMWRPEHVVCVEGCGSMAGGATARVASTSRLKVLFPWSVPSRM